MSLHVYIFPSLPTHITLVFKDVTLGNMQYTHNVRCKMVLYTINKWSIVGRG